MLLLIGGQNLKESRRRAEGDLEGPRARRPLTTAFGALRRRSNGSPWPGPSSADPPWSGADQPTGNLDEEGSTQVTYLLRELNQQYDRPSWSSPTIPMLPGPATEPCGCATARS